MLSRLDPDKALGCDKISPKILRACASSLSMPITTLFRFPGKWKMHMISPIPKSGDPSKISNYRPIFLLCIVAKAMESLVYDKIIDFIRPRLSSVQFGFLSNRSSTAQLLTCYNDVVSAFENRISTDVLCLDLQKAFDSVPHQELLFKLWRIGITGNLWSWFEAYLSNRFHFVNYNGYSSPPLPVLSGVPQGSVLGPLLFLVYINDIPASINSSSAFLFADDAKLLKSLASNLDSAFLQEDLDSVVEWSGDWRVKLNSLKSAQLHFSLKDSESAVSYNISGSLICSSSYKDLGITITSSLSWSAHIDRICSRAYRMLHVIRRNIPLTSSISLKKRMYMALVRSHLCYGSQLWRPHLLKDVKNLERVQRRATKFILQDFSSDYKSTLISLGLLPVSMWLELQDIILFLKCLRCPPDNLCILDYVSFSTTNTRSSIKGKLVFHYKRTSVGRHYYINHLVRLWNALPEVNLEKSVVVLKMQLLEFLWDSFFLHFDSAIPCTYHFKCPCSNCHLLCL